MTLDQVAELNGVTIKDIEVLPNRIKLTVCAHGGESVREICGVLNVGDSPPGTVSFDPFPEAVLSQILMTAVVSGSMYLKQQASKEE